MLHERTMLQMPREVNCDTSHQVWQLRRLRGQLHRAPDMLPQTLAVGAAEKGASAEAASAALLLHVLLLPCLKRKALHHSFSPSSTRLPSNAL